MTPKCHYSEESSALVIRQGLWTWVKLADGQVIKMPAIAADRDGQLRPWAQAELQSRLEQGAVSNRQTFFATVVPVMACDLGCSYCIQNVGVATEAHRPQRVPVVRMQAEVVHAVFGFIAKQMEQQGKDKLELLLFGGEPLLAPQLCCELLEKAAECGLTRGSMVSNATRLSPSVAAALEARGLQDIQVTFDGAQADHDSVRVTRTGGPTYEQIRRNVATAQALTQIRFKVRVNLTTRNLERISELVSDLGNHLDAAATKIEFALVDDIGIGFGEVVQEDDQLVERVTELYYQAAELGFKVTAPITTDCSYCGPPPGTGGAVINADGSLYSSWDNLGRIERRVGHVTKGYDNTEAILPHWTACGSEAKYDVGRRQHTTELIARAVFPLELAQLRGA